jgi:hypothetical protein
MSQKSDNVERTINLGPLYNPDGSPSEVTKAMFGHPHHQPNIFLSPFVKPLLQGWLEKFLRDNENVHYEDTDNDSFAFTVEEARTLLKHL